MRVEMLYVGVMGVAGGLAGMAGADTVLGVLYRGTPGSRPGSDSMPSVWRCWADRTRGGGAGRVAVRCARSGGRQMQVATSVPIDLVQIVQALVIVFIAAPALVKALYRVGRKEEVA
jgi:general nucleoside transport system permease protein